MLNTRLYLLNMFNTRLYLLSLLNTRLELLNMFNTRLFIEHVKLTPGQKHHLVTSRLTDSCQPIREQDSVLLGKK